jgi:catechol 2,3-dioxygenase-like lactoylglutathione lyase family enzyme
VLTGIDHIVIVVPDLDAATESYRGLGFNVVPGGRHPIGSHNALVGFADGAYLELIAFFDPAAKHRWRSALERGGGLVDFCMQTDDLEADAAALRGAGVSIGDPWPLSRTRPDGFTLQWVLATPADAQSGVAPFLIEDTTPRHERVPRETSHPNGVTGIATLTVAVSDVATVRRWWSAVLRAPGQDARRDELSATGARFTLGPHTLEFLAPTAATSSLTSWLAARGPSPYSAALTTSGRPGPLDERRALGARLTLV